MAYPSKTDRETILAAAMTQVEEGGINALAMRSLASTLGVAPNALYRYFANLAALTEALAEESRRRLLAALQKAATKKNPEQALRGIAQAYVRFAREEPQVFSLTLLPSSTGEDEAAHLGSWRFVLQHVSRLFGEERAAEAAVALWAFLHGMTALEAAGVFGKRKPASSFEFGLDLWLRAGQMKSH